MREIVQSEPRSNFDFESKLESAMLQKKLKRRNIEKIESLPKVKGFLNSIGRNSKNSKRSYSTGLALLQDYLDSEVFQQRYTGSYDYKCDCETILEPLFQNKINVYEFFDGFVSFILASKPDIAPRSLSLYLIATRSYFAFYDIDVIPSKFK